MQANSTTTEIMHRGHQLALQLRSLFYTPRYNSRMALAINVLFVTLLAYAAARLTWNFLVPPITQQTSSVIVPDQASRSTGNLDNVGSTHLFGVAVTTPQVKGPIEAPDTRLQLVLHGVFASGDPAVSMAIISEVSGKDKSYSKGDALPGGATLHEIYPDRVILSRGGNLETLRLKRESAKITIQKDSSKTSNRPVASTVYRAPELKTIQETFRSNPQEVFKQIRITPVFKDGSVTGYRFYHNNPAVLKQMGLQPQDVITAVNGVSVNDQSALFGLMKNVGQMQELSLSVLRDGTPQELLIRID
jgi:general secretion pathway protein C